MMYVIGLVAVYLFLRYGVRKGSLKATLDQVESIMVYGFLGMILGARLTYVFVYNPWHYLANPMDIMAVWKGGLSFHGALLGVILGVLLFAKRNGIPFLNVTDHVAAVIPIGLGFGRIGNFINGELWGRVVDDVDNVPWAMVCPGAGPYPRHPSQIYEAIFEGLVLLGLLWLIRWRKPAQGVLSGAFLLLYGIMRFFIEFFREPDSQFRGSGQDLGTVLGPFSMGQILCFLMWIVGGIVIVYGMNRKSTTQTQVGSTTSV
jgi:phosphatidylglycerol:prolipoprotein diacylglycerol transferase